MKEPPAIYVTDCLTDQVALLLRYEGDREAAFLIPWLDTQEEAEQGHARNPDDIVGAYSNRLTETLEKKISHKASFSRQDGDGSFSIPYGDGRTAYLNFPDPGPHDKASFKYYIEEFVFNLRQALESGQIISDSLRFNIEL